MRALTIRQPWADAITHGTKRIENRTWPIPTKHLGTRILIHSGAAYDHDARYAIDHHEMTGWPDARQAFLATATLADCHRETGGCCDPWGEHGVWHWQFDDVTPLPKAVPAKGALGFWTPPPHLTANGVTNP